jgi:hypothetical protein
MVHAQGRGRTARTAPATHKPDPPHWLQAHADEYGFVNLPSEPWHWSVNGRLTAARRMIPRETQYCRLR